MDAEIDVGPSPRMPIAIGECAALYCSGTDGAQSPRFGKALGPDDREGQPKFGALINFRQATEDDAAALSEFFRGLPLQSRYDRFLCGCAEPPALLAAQLKSQDHVVLVAEIAGSTSSKIVAEARIAADPGDCASCEVAMTVAGDWQGAGIGWTLFWALRAQAISLRLRFIRADILTSNIRALSLARKLGCAFAHHAEDGRLYRVSLALP